MAAKFTVISQENALGTVFIIFCFKVGNKKESILTNIFGYTPTGPLGPTLPGGPRYPLPGLPGGP